MRYFITLLLCVGLILSGCTSTKANTDSVEMTQYTTAETEASVEVMDYPDVIGTDEEKLLTPLLSDELFDSTAEENGMAGTLFQIYGTVENLILDNNGNIDAISISTHKGDIVVSDPCQQMISSGSMDDIGTIDEEKLREYFPLPSEGEFIRIFAEYQGMSNKYDCPYFIYGSQDYLIEAIFQSISEFADIDIDTEAAENEPVEAETDPPDLIHGTLDNPYIEGMYKVGSDIPAGEYVFIPHSGESAYVCASTDSNQDDIIENELSDGIVFMTISDDQYLSFSHCQMILAENFSIELGEDGTISEGMYRVGIDIPAGEYHLTATDDSGYWCVYNSSAIPFDIVNNDLFERSTYVTVQEGQYLTISQACASPV